MQGNCAINVYEGYEELVNNICNAYRDANNVYPWVVGFSGGKDSTLVAHLVFESVLRIAPKLRTRNIYFVSNDTLVESPFVKKQIDEQFELINNSSRCFSLPIKTIITKPDIENSFWSLLIGKGYPCPNQKMRWCTDRLKIKPTSKFILDNVSKFGASIIILGVRKDESSSRKKIIEKYKNLEGSYLTPHTSLKGTYVYRPIVDLKTSDVWSLLSQNDPPWGGTHEKLIQMYKDADGGECPLVITKDEAPSCGTSSSRFGCWVCTVVNKDKSLQGFVNSGQNKYKVLIDFRDWLVSIRNNPEYRQVRRRNGQLSFKASGEIIGGPFTLSARREILNNLMNTQAKYGEQLISDSEISYIKSIWVKDMLNRMEGA